MSEKKMATFDSAFCKELRPLLASAFEQISEQYGNVKIKAKSMRYDPDVGNVRFTVEVANTGGEGSVSTEEATYNKFQAMCDLPPFGSTFRNCGTLYTICGFKPRSPKFPVLAKREDGTVFKFPEAVVKARCKLAQVG